MESRLSADQVNALLSRGAETDEDVTFSFAYRGAEIPIAVKTRCSEENDVAETFMGVFRSQDMLELELGERVLALRQFLDKNCVQRPDGLDRMMDLLIADEIKDGMKLIQLFVHTIHGLLHLGLTLNATSSETGSTVLMSFSAERKVYGGHPRIISYLSLENRVDQEAV